MTKKKAKFCGGIIGILLHGTIVAVVRL